MNKNTTYVVLGLAVLAIIAFLGYRALSSNTPTSPLTQSNPIVSPTPVATPPPNTRTFTISEQNNSGESGQATLVETNGKVVVTLDIVGEPLTANQPAHIHLGSCPTPGAVKFPLANVVNGTSQTTIDTTLVALKGMMPLAINVHESQANINNYVACGDLVF